MQRMALAFIIGAAVVAVVTAVRLRLGRRGASGSMPVPRSGTGLQKVSFVLLAGLIFYTAFGGAQ